ncbi:hypothetical protein BC835DRAFT_1410044 [Cytidiella melzeri]|nr:hypothetical protein BC835DRAFT_1410044 [Cytidiella melzeri]
MADQQNDAALLHTFAQGAIHNFVSVVVSTWLVALYTWLVIKCGVILLQKERRRNKIAISTWSIVLAMYSIKLTLWFIDARNIIYALDVLFVQDSSDTLVEKQLRANQSVLKLDLVEDVLYAYMVVLGDAIVLWRVYAFWHTGHELFVLAIPAAVYLGSFVCAGLVTYCAAQSTTNLAFGAFTNPHFCRNIQHTSYWMQFGMAAVATLLIGYKTWRYRRMIRTLLGDEVTWISPVSKAMIIMLDTGVLYMLFFLAEAIFSAIDIQAYVQGHSARALALEIYQYQTSAIVGIYPTIVVILVHTHTRSFLIDSQGSQTVSTLRFDDMNRTGTANGVTSWTTGRPLDSGDTFSSTDVRRSRRADKFGSPGPLETFSLSGLKTMQSESRVGLEEEDEVVEAKGVSVDETPTEA